MMRPSVMVAAMSMLAACGGLAYLHTTREQAAEDQARAATESKRNTAADSLPNEVVPANDSVSGNVAASTTAAESSPEPDATVSTAAVVATPELIAQWIRDTRSTDAKTRAAAIAALANAPKAQAMPPLERVLESGEPEVDRHIALRSMHALALRDGDASGQIRDVMRQAIYHGDNDGVTQNAQSLLDDLQAELAQREQLKN